jgi:hypothetical protein
LTNITTDRFELMLDACGPSNLSNDDFLGLWDVFVRSLNRVFHRGFTSKRILKILDCDRKLVIARRPTALWDVLERCGSPFDEPLRSECMDVVRKLLDQMRNPELQACWGRQHALDRLVYEYISQKRLERVRSSKLQECRGKKYILNSLAEDQVWRVRTSLLHKETPILDIITIFLEAGVSAYRDWTASPTLTSAFEQATRSPIEKTLVRHILKHQPLREHPYVDVGFYIARVCTAADLSILKSIVASSDNGPEIITSRAAEFCSIILGLVPKTRLVHEITSRIDCLEFIFETSGGSAFDVPPLPLDEEVDETSRERREQVVLARTLLMEYTVADTRDISRSTLLPGWKQAWRARCLLFQNRVEFNDDPSGETRPHFGPGVSISLAEKRKLRDLWTL